MNVGGRIEGLDEAVEELNAGLAEIKQKSAAGLWEAGLLVMRAAQQELQKSVRTGNLRASGYVRRAASHLRPEPDRLIDENNEPIPSDGLEEIEIELGFTANYSIFVHENMEGRSPKYLESVITRNTNKIIEIVKRRSGGE